ncbi:uncharacterized protein G2W53_023302 [Senna tora]|uniref:Uncharacterized protein n=1 Tax=Senna tora TaxID=362788 RepID=A0A834TBI3_9FABA|nr:uncharacterized protein G2W53_023302 [Senna tora]
MGAWRLVEEVENDTIAEEEEGGEAADEMEGSGEGKYSGTQYNITLF